MLDYYALERLNEERQAKIRADVAALRGIATRGAGEENRARGRRAHPARLAWRGAILAAFALAWLLLLATPAGAAGTVRCTPNNAPVGTLINVAMAGLPSGEAVTVTTASASGGTLARRSMTVGADGSLTLDLDTSADAPGDYTVQAIDRAGNTLAQGRYSLTAAPRLPNTGGGYATQAAGGSYAAQSSPSRMPLVVGIVAGVAATVSYAIRQARGRKN